MREEAENSLETVNIYTHPDYVDGETFADLTIGNSNTPAYSMLDVVNFDASEFLGTLTVNYAVIQSPDNYTYELGNTDDTLDLHVFDNALFQQNTSLSIIGNNGDNTINVNYGQAAGVDGQNTLIRTGNGDDTVVISAVPPTQVWDGPITDIRTGTGNDAVFLNGHREFCNIDTGEKTIYQNTGAEYFFFGGHLQVTLAGLESEWIAIDWNRNDFTTTNAQLKQAVRDAIDSRPDLAALVDYEDADGGGLDIILNTGGDFSNQTFSVDVRGPVTNLESTRFAGGVGGAPGVTGYNPQGNYDGWPDSYLNFPALAGVMTEADARQLVDAWQAYFGPQSNVGLDGTRFNGEITGTDPNDAPDFRSGDGATSPDFAGNPGAALDADNINDFLEWIQYNADSLDIFGNTFSDDGFDITGQHEVNLGRGHDVVVTPGGRGSRTDVIVNDNHFDYNTILSHSNFGWLGWNIDFRGDNYRDEVANGRGLSINPTLDGDDNVRDGHVPYTTVSMRELSPIDGRVERIDDWVRDGGGQHNSTTYMDFSDLWDLLQDPGSEQDAEEADILNRDVLTPTDSFYSFGSDELQSALNYWLTLGNDVRDADDYFFARYPNLDLGGDVSVIGAEFVVLVGKNGEVIQDEWDTGDNDQPDPYDHWRINNEFANGEFKVFSGRVIEREIDNQDVLAFGNFTEHGIFNLAGDINPSFNFHDLDYFIDRLLDPEPPEDQPFFEITSVVGFDDIQVGESFTATVTFTNTGDAMEEGDSLLLSLISAYAIHSSNSSTTSHKGGISCPA
ncbi:hypothetical protein [Desulfonatronospira sp.]|uniref:hypothetical protein n=1 Tax=Desulfonatronospira sp. TaxID=1962951 RepID=UPI0025B7D6E5|nr:hypothetical protein [Desulfonatronospira sp.]